jgi:hypothetical protein
MSAVRVRLLNFAEGVDELLEQTEIRAQPPQQQQQQQGHQGDNYQILQIKFSAVIGTLMMREFCD